MEADLPEVRRALKRARQQASKFRKRRKEGTVVTDWCLRTALCIASAFKYDMTAAVVWLQSKHRRGAPVAPGTEDDTLKEVLENYFLEADVDVLGMWFDPSTSVLPPAILATADHFVKEHQLSTWVWSRNHLHGTVVRTEMLIEQYNTMTSAPSASAEEQPLVAPATTSTGRNWAHRWRGRHGAKHGKLRVEEPITLEEKRTKVVEPPAAIWVRFSSLILVPKLEPVLAKRSQSETISGTKMGTIFWDRNGGHDPSFGTKTEIWHQFRDQNGEYGTSSGSEM